MGQIRPIPPSQKKLFDKLTSHPLQSWAWGEFRENLGQKVIRLGEFDGENLVSVCQFFIHNLYPSKFCKAKFCRAPFPTLAYCPRSSALSPEMLAEIKKIAQKNNCIFVKFEPNIIISKTSAGVTRGGEPHRPPALCAIRAAERRTSDGAAEWQDPEAIQLVPAKSLFTPYTFQLDLTKSENELLKNLRPKTRYNINLARKKGVVIAEDNSDEAFEIFQKLTAETTERQKFFAHTPKYRQLMWRTMRDSGIAHLLLARYSNPSIPSNPSSILSAWVLFFWNDIAYYPYGASSSQYRHLMASNLLAWEALLLAKKNGCYKFDFWGALGPSPVEDPEHSRRTGEPDKNDPWYGFHRFKQGYGGKLVEFIGTYDLVINPLLYKFYNLADKLRWLFLRHI